MNKKMRAQILAKTNGVCFYCGCNLPEKGWQADHFHPVIRLGKKMCYPELDTLENLVPSCAPCNNFKSASTIDGYRAMIADQFENVQKYSTGMRQLVRLGLVDMSPVPVRFWYEENGIKVRSIYEMIGVSKEAIELEWFKDTSEPNYYGVRMPDGICSIRHIGADWLVIYIGFDWEEKGRTKLPNGRLNLVKAQAAEWALKIHAQKSS